MAEINKPDLVKPFMVRLENGTYQVTNEYNSNVVMYSGEELTRLLKEGKLSLQDFRLDQSVVVYLKEQVLKPKLKYYFNYAMAHLKKTGKLPEGEFISEKYDL